MRRSPFTLRLSPEERASLLQIAEARGCAESAVIRDLVAEEARRLASVPGSGRGPPERAIAEDLDELAAS